MRDYSDWVFSQAPQGAVVLSNWDAYPGLLFAQKVDGQRTDLHIYAVQPETWRDSLPAMHEQFPGAAILLARSLPFPDSGGTQPIGSWYFLSIKGRTYQDQSHGQPWPASVQLFQVE